MTLFSATLKFQDFEKIAKFAKLKCHKNFYVENAFSRAFENTPAIVFGDCGIVWVIHLLFTYPTLHLDIAYTSSSYS